MNAYTISHYENGMWIWDGVADANGITTANLPTELYDWLDRELEPGESRDVTIDGTIYRIERGE